MPQKNPYQKQAHDCFEARFSGKGHTDKAQVPSITLRDPAFYRLDPREFVEKLFDLYNGHFLEPQKLTAEERRLIQDSPRVTRLEVLPQEAGLHAPFYIAAKTRNDVLNEVELGHLSDTTGYKIRSRISKDVAVILDDLVRMRDNETTMPRKILPKNHPLFHQHLEKETTMNYLYARGFYHSATLGPQPEESRIADTLIRAPAEGMSRVQIIKPNLMHQLTVGGIEQELVDLFHEETGYLPINGQIRRPSNQEIVIDTAVKGLPFIRLLVSPKQGFVGFEFKRDDKLGEAIVKKAYLFTRAATEICRD